MHTCNMTLFELEQITYSCALIQRHVNAKTEVRTRDVDMVWTSLWLIEHYFTNGLQHRAFSTLTLGGKPWPNSRPCCFIPEDRDPKTH
jgi:hypothetical protein